jgi:hypothetical protein
MIERKIGRAPLERVHSPACLAMEQMGNRADENTWVETKGIKKGSGFDPRSKKRVNAPN